MSQRQEPTSRRYPDSRREGDPLSDEALEMLDESQKDGEDTRKIAQRELELLASRQERLKALERDREAIVESYARMAPEALDALAPEERHQFYRMLRLRVVVDRTRLHR
jgi:hypothetical protein